MKHQILCRIILLTAALAAAGWSCAQQTVTKSGTPVSPAPKQAAGSPKASAPQPFAGNGNVYIAVCPAELEASLQPLLQWRRQQGYQVELIRPATNKRDTIRQQLMQRYFDASPLHPAQRYVLLVGDVDRIQAFIGKHTPAGLNTSVTDLYYGEYTGDYLPEAAVGRIPATDSTELAAIVAKIIDYEKGCWTDQQHQLLLAAGHEEGAPALTTTNGQVNYLAQLAADCRPELDTVCFYNPAIENQRDQLLDALSQGNALVNYTAHCTRAGWSNPNVNILGFDTMESSVPTIFVNNCCLSNAFDGTCFGEQLLRMTEGGAAAVVGATNETLWNEDFYWAVGAQYPPSLHPQRESNHPGAFDSLFAVGDGDGSGWPADHGTLGALLHAGCRAVSQTGSAYDAFYWETYCLLGDPATVPYLGRTDTLALTLLDTLRAGCTELHLMATPGCRITAMADTLPLGCTTADSNGSALLRLTLPLNSDSLLLTATRRDARPLTMTVGAEPAANAMAAVVGYQLTESPAPTLSVRINNISNYHVCRHVATICQDSSDRATGAVFDSIEPQSITLAPQGDTVLAFMPDRLLPGDMPLLRAQCRLSDSNNHTYSTLHLVAEVCDQRPLVTSLQLTDSIGNPARRLIPGEKYHLSYTLAAEADSVTLDGEGISWFESNTFTVDDEAQIYLLLTPHKDTWYQIFDYYFTCYEAIEHFETGIHHYPWKSNSLFPWQLDSTASHSGGYSLRSGAVGHNMQSELVLEVETLCDDSISFWLMASSEANDFLNFYVDGKRRGWWSGNTGWKRWGCPLTAGHHQLRWSYQKNASGSERSDCAWIDDVSLPFCLWDKPYGISGGASSSAINEAAAKRLDLYPNPTNGEVTIAIESNSHARMLALYDPLGQVADKIFLAPGCNSIQYSATKLRYNIYLLVLYDEHQQPIAYRKLIVTAK